MNQKHLVYIPETALITKAEQDHLEHDVRRDLEKVERGTRALIEFATTSATKKGGLTKIGLSTEYLCFLRTAVRTGHVGR